MRDVHRVTRRARALTRGGKHELALALLERAFGRVSKATDVASLAFAWSAVHHALGRPAAERVERLRRAATLIEACRNDRGVGTLYAKIKHRLAMCLNDVGATEESILEWFSAADAARVAPATDVERSWILLGIVPLLLDHQRYVDAHRLLTEAISLKDPLRHGFNQFMLDRVFLARALIGLGRDAEAHDVLRDALAAREEAIDNPHHALVREARSLLDIKA